MGRYDTAAGGSTSSSNRAPTVETTTNQGGTTTGTSSQTGSQTTTQGPTSSTTATSSDRQVITSEDVSHLINTQNMDPASLAALTNLINSLSNGGTAQMRGEIEKKKQTQSMIEQLLGQFTTEKAMGDASGAMALNLKQAMEKLAPQIQRAIEGAGTSASSMQALLSQNLARDASLSAAALGAEQAKAYAGATTDLMSQLAAMASNMQDPTTSALLEALGIAKGATTSTQDTSHASGTQTTTGSETSQTTTTPVTTTSQSSSQGTTAQTTPSSTQTTTMSPSGSSSSSSSGSSSGSDTPFSGMSQNGFTLNPNIYYSNLGQSGGGLSLSDFLLSN